MSARCTGEPVSWLRLERYHLDELRGEERAEVTAHLATCPACAECLACIAADDAVALAPLPVVKPAVLRPARARWQRGAVLGGALAMAAALVLALGPEWRRHTPAELAGAGGVKGSDLAFSLVRDDDERIAGPLGVYRDGDRFKAVVTCPPSLAATFDLVVFDEGGASFPLAPAQRLACGNEIPLAGALRLTGSAEETVCLVWSDEGAPDRATLTAGPKTLGAKASCKRLTGVAP